MNNPCPYSLSCESTAMGEDYCSNFMRCFLYKSRLNLDCPKEIIETEQGRIIKPIQPRIDCFEDLGLAIRLCKEFENEH